MNKHSKSFSLKDRIKSFSYAANGFKVLFSTEHNARIHLVVAILVLILSWFLEISKLEWIIILFCIGLVFITELFNSAIEYLADFATLEQNETIGKVKDLAAAGVLVSAIISVVIGLLVFVPKIFLLLI